MTGKRRFGRVRRLPSGRYQARYRGPAGLDRPAPGTFATKTERRGGSPADGVSKLAERKLRSRKPGRPEHDRARDGHEKTVVVVPKVSEGTQMGPELGELWWG